MSYVLPSIEATTSLATGEVLTFESPDNVPADPYLRIRLCRGSRKLAALAIPFPARGFAGGSITVAPSGRVAVIGMYSGQSTEGYMLVAIHVAQPSIPATPPDRPADLSDSLTIIGHCPYVHGIVATYAFSPDETRVAMLMYDSPDNWTSGWPTEGGEELDDGAVKHVVGTLRVHEIATGIVSVHELDVMIDPDSKRVALLSLWEPESPPAFVSNDVLRLSLPWGLVDLSLPVAERVVCRPR